MALEAGTRLGTFEVLSPLGAGGMGEVYRAHDTELGREVALKLLPESLADDPERLARLKREARALAALNHPGIATVHEIGDADGTSFLVMELVEGPTLAERLERGALPVDEALELGHQIAAALEAAHEKAIIHRDLKNANIKLTKEGQVKLLDFGLAKVAVGGEVESEGPTAAREGTAALFAASRTVARSCPSPPSSTHRSGVRGQRSLSSMICTKEGCSRPTTFRPTDRNSS